MAEENSSKPKDGEASTADGGIADLKKQELLVADSPPIWSFSFMTVWLSLFCDYSLNCVIIPVVADLDVSVTQTGYLFSGKAAMQIVLLVGCSHLVDKYGLDLLVFGLAADICSAVIFRMELRFSYWIAARMIQGAGSAAIITAGLGHLQRKYAGHEKRRGVVMSLAATGIISGVLVGPIAGGFLWHYGPHAPFDALLALLAAALLCAVALSLSAQRRARNRQLYRSRSRAHLLVEKEEEEDLRSEGEGEGEGEGEVPSPPTGVVFALLADPDVCAPLGMLLVGNLCIAAFQATIGLYLVKEVHFTPKDVGLLCVISTLPAAISASLAGIWGNRIGRRTVVITGAVCQGIAMGLGGWAANLRVEMVSLAGIGWGMGLIDGVVPAMLANASDRNHSGTSVVYALSTTAIQLGYLLGPLIGTRLMDSISFSFMSLVVGGSMIAYAPFLLCASDSDHEEPSLP